MSEVKILSHDVSATGHDGEGVGLECSCGWEWNSGQTGADLAVLVDTARQHLNRMASGEVGL